MKQGNQIADLEQQDNKENFTVVCLDESQNITLFQQTGTYL